MNPGAAETPQPAQPANPAPQVSLLDRITNLEALDLLGTDPLALVSQDWAEALSPVEPELRKLGGFLRAEFDTPQASGTGPGFLPAPKNVLRAFQQPLSQVKVLIVGQDPYPTPGHPIGLSFAVERHVRPIPRSLINIYQELHDDLGLPPAEHGDLSSWAGQGVLLLNRALTVRPGTPASHRGKGWEQVTEAAIQAIVARHDDSGRHMPLVALLWGNDARNLTPLLNGAPTVASAHPSPLSASRGFFGSRPFSQVNNLLRRQGAAPVDWTVT